MTSKIATIESGLKTSPKTWLVTEAAGFIGSHLVERLLKLGQRVVGFDNLSTGKESNISLLNDSRYTFVRGDIRDQEKLDSLFKENKFDFVLHEAALGSVPRSIDDPITSHDVNVTGFLKILDVARKNGAPPFVYASSSAVYGDLEDKIKVEERIGRSLSPYGATKRENEVLSDSFLASYGMRLAGLRYFNVFGPRQDPEGPYAAVVPRWLDRLMRGENCIIYGDGETKRDFTYVENIVDANILAAVWLKDEKACHEVFNVGCGVSTTLKELYMMSLEGVKKITNKSFSFEAPIHEPFRVGDIRMSLAGIDKIKNVLGYEARVDIGEGLKRTVASMK